MPPIRGVRPAAASRPPHPAPESEGSPPALDAAVEDAADPGDFPSLAGERGSPDAARDPIANAHSPRDEGATLFDVLERPDPTHPNARQSHALDPWGAQEDEPDTDEEAEPDPQPGGRKRGGGVLTIPILCIGVAIIACASLLPMADELHQISWEREKLKVDLAHLKEQVRVNEEFLARVADDPNLAERLAQRQMKYIREGQHALPVRAGGKNEMSPFHLVNVPPPPPMPPYQPVGGALATLVRAPRAQLYMIGLGLLLVAVGLVLGYVPKDD